MRDYVIITDSTCDLPLYLINKIQIEIIPMIYNLDRVKYTYSPAFRDLNMRNFYQQLRNGKLATTTQINSLQYEKNIEKHLKEDKDVLVISLSSKLSGNYNSLEIAKDNLTKQYPNHNIIIFDSLAASLGLGMLVYYAYLEKEKEKSIFEVENWLRENYLDICHWLIVDDLIYLQQSGRLTGGIFLFNKYLKMKPLLHINHQGKLNVAKKVFNKQTLKEELYLKLKETAFNVNNQIIFISHSDCYDEALKLKERILTDFHPKDLIISEMGPIIGTHTGPDALALCFVGSER